MLRKGPSNTTRQLAHVRYKAFLAFGKQANDLESVTPARVRTSRCRAQPCGLAAEGNCSCDTVRLVSHVRRGVLVAFVSIVTLALEFTPSTCRRLTRTNINSLRR
jgi:hypothetical protein